MNSIQQEFRRKYKQDQVNNADSAIIFLINNWSVKVVWLVRVVEVVQDVQIVQVVQVVKVVSLDDMHTEDIYFTWSKQSNYRENLRCHACD